MCQVPIGFILIRSGKWAQNLEASMLSNIYKISWLVFSEYCSNEKQVMLCLEEMISKGERVNINSSFEECL